MPDQSCPPPRIISGLREIADRYDGLLVDVWGVVHDGVAPFYDAAEACRRFRGRGGGVVLVSNSPRTHAGVAEQFAAIGVADDFYDAIVTSGDVTRALLAARAPGPAAKIGPPRDDAIYEGAGLAFAPLAAAAFISCTGLADDDVETPADYAERLKAAAARGLEMVCANPDIVVQKGDRLIWCAGALARDYARLGGRVVFAGKPHRPIYEAAFAALGRVLGRSPDAARVLMVGDGPETDLAGAAGAGIDALFIAQGIHAAELGGAALTTAALGEVLARSGARAAYAARALAW